MPPKRYQALIVTRPETGRTARIWPRTKVGRRRGLAFRTAREPSFHGNDLSRLAARVGRTSQITHVTQLSQVTQLTEVTQVVRTLG